MYYKIFVTTQYQVCSKRIHTLFIKIKIKLSYSNLYIHKFESIKPGNIYYAIYNRVT